jgi:hypothetical protein
MAASIAAGLGDSKDVLTMQQMQVVKVFSFDL